MELAVSTDLLLEGRNFRAGADPRKLGHKRSRSTSPTCGDGCCAALATLAIALPSGRGVARAFCNGSSRSPSASASSSSRRYTRGPLTLCVTILAKCPRPRAVRAGAGPATTSGCRVSSRAALGLARPGIARRRSAWTNPSRASSWASARGIASAAIDVSTASRRTSATSWKSPASRHRRIRAAARLPS